MSRFAPCAVLALLLAGGCAPVGSGPSLAPRAAESIDPRLPVPDRSAALPADPQLAAEVGALRDRALAAAERVEPALRAASAAVAAAGPRESESWIAAQQLVSAAIAERAPFTRALGDLDALLSERLRSGRRLVPQDLARVRAIAAELASVDRRQAEQIEALERRLG